MIVDIPGHLPTTATVAEATQLRHEVQSGAYQAAWVAAPAEPMEEGPVSAGASLEQDVVSLGDAVPSAPAEAPELTVPDHVVPFDNTSHYAVHPTAQDSASTVLYGAASSGYLSQRVEGLWDERVADPSVLEDGLDGDQVTMCATVQSLEPEGYSRRPKRFTGRWGKKRLYVILSRQEQKQAPEEQVILPAPWPAVVRTWRNRSRSARVLYRSAAENTLEAAVFVPPMVIRLVPMDVLTRRTSPRTARQAALVATPSALKPLPHSAAQISRTDPV
jgi:hypothetical protein